MSFELSSLVPNRNHSTDIIYVVCACSEPKLNVSLDGELIELWRKTALPADPAELDAELRRAGLVCICQSKPIAKSNSDRRWIKICGGSCKTVKELLFEWHIHAMRLCVIMGRSAVAVAS